jgi:hypothetical protein
MGLISSAITYYLKRRIPSIERVKNHPIEAQDKTFLNLITRAANTEWGRRYNYHKIRNVAQYQETVPVQPYETVFPYIERMMRGEQNILWPGKITWFSKSSGTTNDRSKFIPVSKESLRQCHYKGGSDLIALYLHNRPLSRVLHGKNLAIGGTYQPNELWEGSYYGDVSAVLMKNLPSWAQYLRRPSIETALMSEWEAKLERIANQTIKEDITSISGVPTWMVVLLNKVLHITGAKDISEVWPNLEVFLHGAVSFTPYRRLFAELITNPNMAYLETYNASEGFFGVQDDLALQDQMLLMLDYGIFYEFMPMEELGKNYPKTLLLDDVEVGKNYALVISTNGGLWRYLIGDTIKFASKYPFRIHVSGRTKHFINAFGEELMVENADRAIEEACKATNAVIKDYTAAPVYMGNGDKGCHEWLVEFEREPDDMERFEMLVDESLRRINSDYDAKRYKDIALSKPLFNIIPKNTFYTWLAAKGKLGGQHKVPRLSNNREILEAVKSCITMVVG